MFSIKPIGTVHSSRTEVRDDFWGDVPAVIELAPDMPGECLNGIEDFSHAEIIFLFDKVDASAIVMNARHPRNNPAWPRVGIFAQRTKYRPNRLGCTIVRILKQEGRRLHVAGLDALDGTPVVDIKPVMAEFLPQEPIRQPGWTRELMRDYWLPEGKKLTPGSK
jgi:tRNA-Thr(GGU) m(6)t(6)A37 methyltransferase TsaA